MNSQLVSIIIPCYGQAHFLHACLQSIQSQTHHDWEAIIVNDGSPDDTRDVALSLVSQDDRIRYVEKPNGGLSSARNRGLTMAKGRWLQFLDADDLLQPNKLELQLGQLISTPDLAMCHCDYWAGDASDPRVRLPQFHKACEFVLARPELDMAIRWEWEFSIPIHAALFDVRLFHELGVVFDEELPNHEDWDMWMQVLRHRPRIFFVPDALVMYRVSPTSMSRNREQMRRGFGLAVSKQTKAFAQDREIVEALGYTTRMIDYHYHRAWRSRLRRMADGSLTYRKLCPWPIQKGIDALTTAPRPPFALARLQSAREA